LGLINMRFLLLLLLPIFSAGQESKYIGLYNECDSHYSGYICQQFQLLPDSTFILYDLLHLRGWSLSHGTWQIRYDTLYLNSIRRDVKMEYEGKSSSDSVLVNFLVDDRPPAYSTIVTDSVYQLDSSGNCTILKNTAYSCVTQFLGVPNSRIYFDISKVYEAEQINVLINSKSLEQFYFENEKWLIKDNKIYHTLDSLGNYDEEIFYEKTKLKKLKYKKN
ncbi:MAG: hypothetical protein MK105_15810, partial [Crocinitomicaceae bacterium]|nr:hypothetical protein [Crocinitomicaceae bacterium]